MKIGIVGAGINGLYLAWKLSQQGHNITIFERKSQIGNDICSGLFSRRILDFIPSSQKLIENRINHVFLHFPKKTIKVNFSKEFFAMNHLALDKLVANLAQSEGAKILFNYNIKEIPNGFDKIIGCDGVNSIIRERLNLPNPSYRLGILGFVNKPCSNQYVETWPCPHGFIWKIPRINRIEYGIMANPEQANKLFDDFLKREKISLEKKAKLIPHGLLIPKTSSTTLCGDAAGITKLWSGGGVVWGLYAANILLETFPDFGKYRKKTKKFFFPKIILSKIAVRSVYFAGFKMPWILPKQIGMESDFLL